MAVSEATLIDNDACQSKDLSIEMFQALCIILDELHISATGLIKSRKNFLFMYFLQIFAVQEAANRTNTETVEVPQKLFLKQVMKKGQVQLRKLSKLQY